MDFPENRRGGNCDRFFSRGVLCQEDHETEARSQSCSGWNPDNASCTSAYSRWLLPAFAFARAIGEYGATSMLAGNILGKTRTVSVAIASETAAGNFDMAGFWVVVIILISFLVVAAINIVSGRGMQTRRWI